MANDNPQHDPKYQAFLNKLQKHNTRASSFFFPPAALDSNTEIAGHFHFGVVGIDRQQLHSAFDRSGCAARVTKSPDAVTISNFGTQSELLGAAERTYLEMTQTKVQHSVYAMSRKMAHGLGNNVVQKFFHLTLNKEAQASGSKPGGS